MLMVAVFICKNAVMNWNDLKYLLALSRLGTLSAVAKESGVDMTTVSRRLKALEASVGSQLFLRIDNRYVPTAALSEALADAERAETGIERFQRALKGQDQSLQGTIRITSVHTFINSYLLSRLQDFYVRYPEIELEIIADSSQLDMGRHEADLALRMGRPEQSSLVTRRMTDLYYAVYANTRWQNAELAEMPWILFEERFQHLPEARWQQTHFPDVDTPLRCNVGPAIMTAAAAGLGAACLPCYMGGAEPVLEQRTAAFPLRTLWLLMHPEKRTLARIRAFIDWLEQQLAADQSLFMGSAHASPE